MKIHISSIVLFTAIALISTECLSANLNSNIEMAAKINVAENVCDVNFGGKLLHFVMLGAGEMRVDLDTAAKAADRRHMQIVRYLNRNGKLDQFCSNARRGKL